MKKHIVVGLILGATLAASGHAETSAEYPEAVALFAKTCLGGSFDAATKAEALAADSGWTADAADDVDVPALSISRAIDRNFDYSKPETVRQWSRQLNGQRVRAIVATFPAKRRYRAVCAVLFPGVKSAMPYADEAKAAFQAAGVKGKSVDLVHYFEFASKVGPDKRPVRGEIFSRSQALGEKDTMHLYLAF